MKVNLWKFFEAYEGKPHQLAAVHLLQDTMPEEFLDKFSEWVTCFEVDGEVEPLPEYTHKGYHVRDPNDI